MIKSRLLATVLLLFLTMLLSFTIVNASPNRWHNYGIFEGVFEEILEEDDNTQKDLSSIYITNNQFARIMQNLLGYEIDQRYTFIGGDTYIQRDHALNILTNALGRPISFAGHYQVSHNQFSYLQLLELLDYTIQMFINTDSSVDLSDIYLHRDIIINIPNNSNLLITNVEGRGNIIISAGHNSQIILNDIDISGNIIIAESRHDADLTLINVVAETLNFLGSGQARLLNNTNIRNINLYNKALIDVNLVRGRSMLPDVYIAHPNVTLVGDFEKVTNSVDNNIIFLYNNIADFHTTGNVIFVGLGYFTNLNAPPGVFVETLLPGQEKAGFSTKLQYMLDEMFAQQLQQIKDLLEALPAPQTPIAVSGGGGTNWVVREVPLPPPMLPDHDHGQDNGTPPAPAPEPEPEPDDSSYAINQITVTINPPSIAQGHIPQRIIAGDNFSGTIYWHYEDGRPIEEGFAHGNIYVARAILVPNQGYHFSPNPDISIDTMGVYHNRASFVQDSFGRYQIIFGISFEAMQLPQADSFSIREIVGPFEQVHIYSQYLGRLLPSNFLVSFGGAPINVVSVSDYNTQGGYYVLNLASIQLPTGYALSVYMLSPLPNHLPHPQAAVTYPIWPQMPPANNGLSRPGNNGTLQHNNNGSLQHGNNGPLRPTRNPINIR